MRLVTYLELLADNWTSVTGRTLSALGGQVVKDGKFFARIAGGTVPSVATFEKFLTFFRDSGNWPDGVIPPSASDLLGGLDAIASKARSIATAAPTRITCVTCGERVHDPRTRGCSLPDCPHAEREAA